MQGQLVFNQNMKRDDKAKAQAQNITAAKAVTDIIRTTLGPRSMLKMILDPMGGLVITNDGNAILREIDVTHPAARHIIELSRAQDEEVGDGTTSVIILAGEILERAQSILDNKVHPIKIVRAFAKALEDAVEVTEGISEVVDLNNRELLAQVVSSCLGTKYMGRLDQLMTNLAIDAVKTVTIADSSGRKEIDIKRYARTEKVPGGDVHESRVLKGIMLNKDVVHARMKRRIEKPRILLLDCPLEYKKGENPINVEIKDPTNFELMLQVEEEYVKDMCEDIIKFKPDLVFTEKGLSDIAAHYLAKAGITAFRRLRKTDNNRIARATGATIIHRPDELQESDIGTKCGLFEVRKIGDEYYCFLEECEEPKACTILLRGGGKDFLNEMERNLQDAMNVARNVISNPRIVYGGGATEMAVSLALMEKSKELVGVEQQAYIEVARSFEVIPATLLANCGAKSVRVLTELKAKQATTKSHIWGIDGDKGTVVDIKELGILEPYNVKVQTFKTACEAAVMLLRIDTIVSGLKGKSP